MVYNAKIQKIFLKTKKKRDNFTKKWKMSRKKQFNRPR